MTRTLLLGLAAALLCAISVLPAVAQEASGEVRIREVQVEDDGTTQLLVSVTGDDVPDVLDASAFTVSENGQRVGLDEVKPLFESEITVEIIVGLVLDLSGSTEGEPLTAAKEAATNFVNNVTADGIEVFLVTFSDQAQLVVPPTEDAAQLNGAIAGLEAGGETAFFDGVALAASELSTLDAQRNILAFTDGADTASQLDLTGAVDAALAAEAAVNTVFLEGTSEFDPQVVERLASATGGTVLSAGSTGELAAAFDEVVARLASQYVLIYTADYEPVDELELSVRVDTDGVSASDSAVALNTRIPPRPEAQPRIVDIEPPGFLGEPLVRDLGIYGAGAALALILALLAVGRSSGRAGKILERSLDVQKRGGEHKAGVGAGMSASAIGKRAVSLVEQMPKPAGSEERLQQQLDRAYWPLRSSEFVLVSIGAALGALIMGWALLGSLIFGLVLMLIGAFVPYVILTIAVQRRQAAFEEQLPDTLQLLAGSLKAGYGMLQAIDTVEKESADPMSTEFRRVLTEARLGLAVEESLDNMADRVGSEDFKWVVVAINIQRKVGGNLAALLETVSNTLRDREQVRRQIKVLSAEGRLSAGVLIGLPFLLVGYLFVVNPDYLSPLFSENLGLIMVAGAMVLMGIGIWWMRKIITIEV